MDDADADDRGLPCPDCDAWLRMQDRHWVCPSCGYRSDEVEDGELEPVPAPEPTPAALAVQQGVATSSPSYARPAGRPRSFLLVVLFTLLTGGIYYLYWRWRVFRELHDQEGTRSWSAFMWVGSGLGLLAFALLLPGYRGGPLPEPTPFGMAVGFAASTLLLAYLLLETKALNGALRTRGRPPAGAIGWLAVAALLGVPSELMDGFGAVFFLLLSAAVDLAGHYFLQLGLNRYWDVVRTQPAGPAPTGLTPVPS